MSLILGECLFTLPTDGLSLVRSPGKTRTPFTTIGVIGDLIQRFFPVPGAVNEIHIFIILIFGGDGGLRRMAFRILIP